MAGFWKLTWVEMKVFLREPMGAIGSLVVPVIIFVILGRALGTGRVDVAAVGRAPFSVPILTALMIVLSAVMSLIAIMAIYREGGILKRLRATPLSPLTILGAHVVVKLVFTAISLVLFILAGRQYFPGAMPVSLMTFCLSVFLSTLSILS